VSAIRTIALSGTTGILPLRDVVNKASLDSGNAFSGIFAGTVNAFSGLLNEAQGLFGTKEIKNVVEKSLVDEGDLSYSTGYYQFKLLERFFDAYAAMKKTRAGRSYVLALEIWKDDNMYLVTPVMFNVRRSAASPLEYNYDLQFKAWKRIKPLGDNPVSFDHAPAGRDPNKLAQALNKIQEARRVLQGAKNVLKGVRADINNVLFTPIREAVMFCKDTLGVANTAFDLPTNIIKDLKEPILESISLRTAGEATGANFKSAYNRAKGAFEDLSVQISKAAINSGRLGNLPGATAGTAGSPGGLGSSGAPLTGASPGDKIADNPDDHADFYETVKPGNLNLRPATQRKIDDERRRVRNLRREDFEKARDSVAAVLTDFEAAVGAENSTYSRIYQTPDRPSTRVPTDSDFEVIFALNSVVMEMNRLAASGTINRNEVSAIDFIAGLASRSGIAFRTPRSKFLVPFPYTYTLEQLSSQYLGTPDRWHEIAALNGLMAPYVDEIGFTLTLLTNGNGNQVTVADISRLFVNQQVWVSSTAQGRTKRRISKIETISPGIHTLTLTGEQNLGIYTVSAGASIQAFLPNTVNSQMSIYIPSDEESDDSDFRHKSIPGIDYFDPLVRVGGIDLLLTANGDLVVTPDGDGRLAVGLTNIVQKVRLVLDTPRGSLLHHPDYGFPVQVGDSTADVSAQDILDICRNLFKGDPTFTGVQSAAILKNGPVVKIALSVGIAGTQQVIPITVEVNR
jgi:hypothetical protein